MTDRRNPITILLADDDEEDCMLFLDACKECRLHNEVRIVGDGEELLEYLNRKGKYAAPKSSPRPDLILLDLNMPRKDGREALKDIKSDPHLRSIPVVILTTSKTEEDIVRSYDLGVNAFITKPVTFDGLVETIKVLDRYWFEIVKLPSDRAE